MKSPLRVAGLALLVPLVAGLLAGCTPTVALTPAKNATAPACASVIVRLPSSVADQAIRQTDAQATGAWGNPTSVVLKCGVTPIGPTEDLCFTVNTVDWVEDSSNKPTYTFTTYGRSPAVQVVINSKATNSQFSIILDALGDAVATIPQNPAHKCSTVINATPTPTPTPTSTPNPTP